MAGESSSEDLIQSYFAQQKELYGDELWVEGFSRNEIPVNKSGKASNEKNLYTNRKAVSIASDNSRGISTIEDTSNSQDENWQNISELGAFYDRIKECQKCSLGKTRNKFVFGVGNPKADLLFIGEAPGRNEDLQGEPFVGRAGQLLNKILHAINLDRSDVYIANILKCRPPKNRDPQAGEIACCEPYLVHQIKLIDPVLIVALGRVAGQTLLRTDSTLGALRGKVHDYHGTDMMVTYHPAALLRNSNFKKPTWEDMQEIQRLYLSKLKQRKVSKN